MRINNHRWAALAVAALILAGCGPSEEEKLVDACTAKSVGMKATVLPLHWAIGDGNVDSVRALIEAGADVNAKDVRGATALHQAAYGNNVAVAAVLIEAGADVPKRDLSIWICCGSPKGMKRPGPEITRGCRAAMSDED